MNEISRLACLGLLAVTLATSSPAHATLVEALDLETLVAEADQVVLARVIGQQSLYDERGRIVTDVVLQVEESIKGDQAPGAAVTLRRLGGVVGDMGLRVSGEPSFETGETVVLFGAHRARGGALRSIGMSQGTLRVFERDGERWVRSANNGVATVKRAGGQLKHAGAALEQPRKLTELLAEVRTLAKRKPAPR
jgi:hypothetical protein